MSTDAMAALCAPPKRHHNIKCWPEYFCETLHGFKTFEIRRNDREYQVRDTVTLHEWDYATAEYTGRSLKGRIGYLYQDEGMAHGFCAFVLEVDENEKKLYRDTP